MAPTGRSEKKWFKVNGERGFLWKWGEITTKFLEFAPKYSKNYGKLVWIEQKLKPKLVCWECLEKYKPDHDLDEPIL